MEKFIKELVEWVFLFGIFVPFGYLPLYWAIPISVGCFLLLANRVIDYMDNKGN
jgi:hypothetical protein